MTPKIYYLNGMSSRCAVRRQLRCKLSKRRIMKPDPLAPSIHLYYSSYIGKSAKNLGKFLKESISARCILRPAKYGIVWSKYQSPARPVNFSSSKTVKSGVFRRQQVIIVGNSRPRDDKAIKRQNKRQGRVRCALS